MRNIVSLTTLARGASVLLAFALPFAGAAYADDEYGTGHEAMIRAAALSAPAPVLTAAERDTLSGIFKVGQNDAFGAGRSSELAPVPQNTASRLASMGRTIDGKVDVVGAGGAQDKLATLIHTPGSGTDF